MTPSAKGRILVAYLDHVARLSGGELALLRTLPALKEHVDVIVILAEDGPLKGAVEELGIECLVLPLEDAVRDARRASITGAGLKLGQAWAAIQYSRGLARQLRRLEVDLVHTNSLKAALYGGLAGRLGGIPVVWHVRDRIADDYLPAAAVRLVRAATRVLPSAVIANSYATLATLPRRRYLTVLASPVVRDAVEQTGRAKATRTGPLTYGLVGRLSPWKGQDVFLRAFAAAFPDGGHRARLVGSAMFGEEEWEGQLRALVDQLGLGNRVEFRGFRRDVAAEYDELDVLVHASTVPEPFGQVVIEGMAAGVPVIASSEGGPAEIITHGVDGQLVEPRRVDLLADAMLRLAAQPELRSRLSRAGLRTAQQYTPERSAAGAVALYGTVLAGRSRRRCAATR